MAVRTFTFVEGELIHQYDGTNSHDILPDPQGNVVGLLGADSGIEFDFEYWPYEEVPSAFSAVTPYRYIGAQGYYSDIYSRVYVVARHYRAPYGRWMTVDPIWPFELAYPYVRTNPVSLLDPEGLQSGGPPTVIRKNVALLDGLWCCYDQADDAVSAASRFCKEFNLGGDPSDKGLCNAMQHCMWACLTARNCGDNPDFSGPSVALRCTDLHEKDAPSWWPNCPGYRARPNPYYPNDQNEKCMDLWNNRIGIHCASASSCYACCVQNAKGGNLQIIDDYPGRPRKWRKGRTDCKRNPATVHLPPFEDLR